MAVPWQGNAYSLADVAPPQYAAPIVRQARSSVSRIPPDRIGGKYEAFPRPLAQNLRHQRGEPTMSIGKPLKFLGRQLLLGTAVTVAVIATGHLVSWLIGWVTVR